MTTTVASSVACNVGRQGCSCMLACAFDVYAFTFTAHECAGVLGFFTLEENQKETVKLNAKDVT